MHVKHELAGDTIDPISLLHNLVVRINRYAAGNHPRPTPSRCSRLQRARQAARRQGGLHVGMLTEESSVRAHPGPRDGDPVQRV